MRPAWQLTELLQINMQLVGLFGPSGVSTSRGCDGYIAASWRRKWTLGAVAKSRNANMSFVMSVCLSVRPHARMEQLGSH